MTALFAAVETCDAIVAEHWADAFTIVGLATCITVGIRSWLVHR